MQKQLTVLGGVHMSPFSCAGINYLEISALLKNTAKNQNLSYEKYPARLNEIPLFSTEIPAKRAELFSYDNSSPANRPEFFSYDNSSSANRAEMNACPSRNVLFYFRFKNNRLHSNDYNKRLFIFH